MQTLFAVLSQKLAHAYEAAAYGPCLLGPLYRPVIRHRVIYKVCFDVFSFIS